MTVKATTKVTINKYFAIAGRLIGVPMQQVIDDATASLETFTRARVVQRSGALAASIYRSTSTYSNYATRMQAAATRYKTHYRTREMVVLPEIERPRSLTGYIAFAAQHGVYVQKRKPFLPTQAEMASLVLSKMAHEITKIIFSP